VKFGAFQYIYVGEEGARNESPLSPQTPFFADWGGVGVRACENQTKSAAMRAHTHSVTLELIEMSQGAQAFCERLK